jgi:hypothetical protein
MADNDERVGDEQDEEAIKPQGTPAHETTWYLILQCPVQCPEAKIEMM